MKVEFTKELEHLINRHSVDNECQTPDFILAEACSGFLCSYRDAVIRRETWHGRNPELQQELKLDDQTEPGDQSTTARS